MLIPQNKIGLEKEKLIIYLEKGVEHYFQMSVPNHVLGEVVFIALYLINKLPSQILSGNNPIQFLPNFFPSVPLMSSLKNRVFGRPVLLHVHCPCRGNFNPHAGPED